MGEVHYMISEAAKRVSVETHVLRYWEEELELTIGRTEMGHRYYTNEDIQLFNCIKGLKEQGMLLKELKNVIPDILQAKRCKELQKKEHIEKTSISEAQPVSFQQALSENNKILETNISQAVSSAVIEKMDFLLQAKEIQEEERYKKLDNLIRQQQSLRRESMRTSPLKNFRKIFE